MQQEKDFSVLNNLLGMIKSQSDFLINFLIFHEHLLYFTILSYSCETRRLVEIWLERKIIMLSLPTVIFTVVTNN